MTKRLANSIKFLKTVFVLCFVGSLMGLQVWAGDSSDVATLRVRPRVSHRTIQDLSFPTTQIQVRIEKQGSLDQKFIATIKGVFARPEWSLVSPDKKYLIPAERKQETASFEFDVVLTSQETSASLLAIGPRGTIQQEDVEIIYPQFLSASTASSELPSLGRSASVSLGLTSITYTQTGLADLSEIVLTPKVAYQIPLGHNWDLGANAFFTALPITSNQSGVKAYFLGVNARIGYSLPFVPKPWSISLAGGAYYTTMFTSGVAFGYKDLFGPQIFPVVRRTINARDSIGGYFKYSPVSEGGSALNFSSHELATGLSVTRLFARGRSSSLSLDYSKITVNMAPVVATSSSVTLGMSYGF